MCVQIYNNALMIDSACRTRDALNYVDDQLSAVRDSRGSMSISDISRLLDNLHSGQSYRPNLYCYVVDI